MTAPVNSVVSNLQTGPGLLPIGHAVADRGHQPSPHVTAPAVLQQMAERFHLPGGVDEALCRDVPRRATRRARVPLLGWRRSSEAYEALAPSPIDRPSCTRHRSETEPLMSARSGLKLSPPPMPGQRARDISRRFRRRWIRPPLQRPAKHHSHARPSLESRQLEMVSGQLALAFSPSNNIRRKSLARNGTPC